MSILLRYRATLTFAPALLAGLATTVPTAGARAENIVFPAAAKGSTSSVIDVTQAPYNVNPNDGADDTAGLQRAISDAVTFGYSRGGTGTMIYLPNGTYYVNNTLRWVTPDGVWGGRVILQGQSRAGTVIRLRNNSAGYGSVSSPKAIVKSGSAATQDYGGDGAGGQAFRNSVRNLTVDCGAGNPGAIGVDFQVSNQGCLRDVTIKSTGGRGAVGLSMVRADNGPGFVKNLSVQNYDTGIKTAAGYQMMTLEHITVTGHTVAAVSNDSASLALRRLTTTSSSANPSAPAVVNDGTGFVCLVEATLRTANLTTSTGPAVVNDPGAISQFNSARMFLRDVSYSGYARAVVNRGANGPTGYLGEWGSDPVLSLFNSGTMSLRLNVRETPEFFDDNLNNWVNVRDFNPTNSADWTAPIQNALNYAASNGKTTVYFPHGVYKVSNTVTVPAGVRRLAGLMSAVGIINNTPYFSGPTLNPVFRFAGGDGSRTTQVDQLMGFPFDLSAGTRGVYFEHADARTVVLMNQSDEPGPYYRNTVGSGPLFVEDVCGDRWTLNNQYAWFRQLNPESTVTKITQFGGMVWILGVKTERAGSVMDIRPYNGSPAYTEVLGGNVFAYGSASELSTQAAFVITDSNVSLTYAGASTTGQYYGYEIQETRNGVTRTLTPRVGSYSPPGSYWRGNAGCVPLYSTRW
jgi:hypothetical protein